MGKICARWVTKLLDDEHKWNLTAMSLGFMSHYHAKEGDLFWMVTGNEKWVNHFTSKMKCASKQGVVKGGDHPVKTTRKRLDGKVYLAEFWNNQGILLEEYAPKCVILNNPPSLLFSGHELLSGRLCMCVCMGASAAV